MRGEHCGPVAFERDPAPIDAQELLARLFVPRTPVLDGEVHVFGDRIVLLVPAEFRAAGPGTRCLRRLLTHDVAPADVTVVWDRSRGKVEQYAFRRPGETIVTLWIGVRTGSRAEVMEAMLEMPAPAALPLSSDMDGNERVLAPEGGFLTVALKRGAPQYLRLIEGDRRGGVFLQGIAAERSTDSFHVVENASASDAVKSLYGELAAAGVSRGWPFRGVRRQSTRPGRRSTPVLRIAQNDTSCRCLSMLRPAATA